MDKRHLPEDLKEFLKLLNSNNVEYLLVGGWAVGFYGYPHVTAEIRSATTEFIHALVFNYSNILTFCPEVKNNYVMET